MAKSKPKQPNMGDSEQIVSLLRDHFIAAGRDPAIAVQTGLEIGVHRGATSSALLRAFPSLMLFMVDPWRGDYPDDHPYRISGDGCAKFSQAEQDENYRIAMAATERHRSRRLILRLDSETAAQRLAGRQFAFVFVDGDHTLPAVRRDIELWWPRIESGGVLCGHDLGHRRDKVGLFGVSQAVKEHAKAAGVKVQTVGTCWLTAKGGEKELLGADVLEDTRGQRGSFKR